MACEIDASSGLPFWASVVRVGASGCHNVENVGSCGVAAQGGCDSLIYKPSCHAPTIQLARVVADVAALQCELRHTQRQVQDIAPWLSKESCELSPAAAVAGWQEESKELRRILAEGLRSAELETAMAINRAIADEVRQVAAREAALCSQLRTEFNDLLSSLRRECCDLNTRAQRLETLSPDLQAAIERNQCELSGLSVQLGGVGARMADLEQKGMHMSKWLESEGRAGKAAIADLQEAVDSTRRQQADCYDGLQQCRDGLRAAAFQETVDSLPREDESPKMPCLSCEDPKTAYVTEDQLATTEVRMAEAWMQAVAEETKQREDAVRALSDALRRFKISDMLMEDTIEHTENPGALNMLPLVANGESQHRHGSQRMTIKSPRTGASKAWCDPVFGPVDLKNSIAGEGHAKWGPGKRSSIAQNWCSLVGSRPWNS